MVRCYTGCLLLHTVRGDVQRPSARELVIRELHVFLSDSGKLHGKFTRSVVFRARPILWDTPTRERLIRALMETPASKRIRLRRNCPHCGISLGKSSYYEHKVVCSKKDESDSEFEIPSDDESPPLDLPIGSENGK